METFLKEWLRDLQQRILFVVWGGFTLLAAFSGPFGAYGKANLVQRLSFWALILALGIVLGSAARALVHGVLGLHSFRVGSFLIALILAIGFPVVITGVLLMPPFRGIFDVPPFSELAVFVFLCSLSVGAYRHASGRIPGARAKKVEDEAVPPVRLLERLPDDLRGDLLAISVRDHYVDVKTDKGSASLLLRLSDAISETEGLHGAQVHRSHWVAWEAVNGAVREGQKIWLTLVDGSRVPVSKTYRTVVEERGIGIA